ncbi:mannose-1-phosphate guanylyltransferase/mannose-6-phosphate isomerase [Arenicella chitinivorans]|uniref:mannose-1-phosphate guanylyltransferase n=1 Tax=Arenicella chitinivorans TaxID=1329800 RepID=A0A918RQV8_9GAMM|nr:mannose-1-phosphate guanylyltransferase/mannose-6-phosphate isomerase [Arenicella chitinivorans]GHA07504.1 mannose-1-phosphate guanylyltransferase/mannose-6-phosphate isomerase [Arenicella chitinivorans]
MKVPVILSGGVGSRLWPLSRGMYPKQLLPITDPDLSPLQQTVLRTRAAGDFSAPIVVCNEEHRFIVGEQLAQVGASDASVMLEPEGRNTAAAIAVAALHAASIDPESVLLVMPADHVILNEDRFLKAVDLAMSSAASGKLTTFGVVPTSPETGYGYIKRGVKLYDEVHQIESFKEKPDRGTAEQYLASGGYYWNGGIFALRADCYLDELQRYAPEVFEACSAAYSKMQHDLDFIRIGTEEFMMSPSISIDYAVMENTDNAAVVALDAGWSDVGSWSALWEVSNKDENGNACTGDVIVHNTRNTHIYSESKLVSAVGVEDLVIVETDDAILVTTKAECQEVKQIVKVLEHENRSHVKHHRKVYRPWGWYDSVDAGDRFQVKRIQVKPLAKLSVQMHNHRAEHWVVVRGVAEVLNGDKTMLLKENESTYIPVGVVHALRNPSEVDVLEIIEVQSGSYLGEDDIVRFEDQYGRAGTTD